MTPSLRFPDASHLDSRTNCRSTILISISIRSYAFVEFRSNRDAEDAYYDMYVFFYSIVSIHKSFIIRRRHGRYFEGNRLSIQVSHSQVHQSIELISDV